MTYIIIIFLVLLSSLFSGLTLGLLSLDNGELKRKISLGDKDAEKVYTVRKRGNLLLCTLLLGNVGVNSAISILLGSVINGFAALFMATGLIVIFGEIIPQATFARYALKIGAKTAWLVKIFIFILFPVCWPIAWALDKALGEEMQTIYSKKELMKIIEEHEDIKESSIDADEERIVKGALSYSDETVEAIITPKTMVYVLDINLELNNKLLNQIKKEGFSRIPVFDGSIDNMKGILYVKDLINIKPNLKIRDVYRKEEILMISNDLKLDRLLDKFIKSKIHLACVENEYGIFEGVVTLEDVIEEIISLEIMDETDKFSDLQVEAKKRANKKRE